MPPERNHDPLNNQRPDGEPLDSNQQLTAALVQLQLGDKDAMAKIIQIAGKYVASVIRSAASRINAVDAEDIEQQTWMQVYQYRHTYVPHRNPRHWLGTVARNATHREFSIRGKQLGAELREDLAELENSKLNTHVLGPQEQVEALTALAKLWIVALSLPRQQAELLERAAIKIGQGREPEDAIEEAIADMELTPAQAAVARHRLRKLMRALFPKDTDR